MHCNPGVIFNYAGRVHVFAHNAALGMFAPILEVDDNPENPVTEPKVTLGRMLHYDTRLSKNRSVSCNTCHDFASFRDDGLKTSKGISE